MKQAVARLAEQDTRPVVLKTKPEYSFKPPNNCYISTSTSPRLTSPTPVLLTGKYGDDYSAKVYLVTSDIFDMPLPSREILNFKLGAATDLVLIADELAELTLIRAVKLPCYNKEYIMPMLHDDTVQCF